MKFVSRHILFIWVLLLVGSATLWGVSHVLAQGPIGTSFTYQGQLKDGGLLANGPYDFQFSLYDAASGGSQVGSTLTRDDVGVTDGLFTVELDFGDVFDGNERWLEIAVRPGDSTGAYTTLAPRQQLTAAPYALHARRFWKLGGNSNVGAGDYLGTSANQSLEFRVNNQRALLLIPNATSPNIIGGYSGNSVTDGVYGAVISGGGEEDNANQVYDNYGIISGGGGNRAGSDDNDVTTARYAAVGGGRHNTASDSYAIVGGGHYNTASGLSAIVGGGGHNTASGGYATVGGGHYNTVSGLEATVSGGYSNSASTYWATVGGGEHNRATGEDATVGGGNSNTASGRSATVSGGGYNEVSGNYAFVGGGYNNIVSGDYATVPGGSENVAQGDYSFAAGRRARAYNAGCFVLTDSVDAYEDCVNDNRFVFRVTNAFYIWTKADHSAGVLLPTGGSAWSSLSDRNVKENFQPVDGEDLLARLARVPILTWNYKAQDPSIRHMGPMAQDFYAAFGLGEDDRHISTIDADGVALAAIQALYQQNRQLRAENDELKARVNDLEARLAALEAAITAMQENAEGGD